MQGTCALIYVPFTLPDRTHGSGSLLVIVMLIRIVLFIVFPAEGVNKSVVLNPSLSHQLCDFELKHRRGLFGTSIIAWWLLWGDCGSNRCGSFVRPTCYAGAVGSPNLSNETMEPVSNEI